MKKMNLMRIGLAVGVASVLVMGSPAAAEPRAVNGTSGAPLGGFGAGGIKFNANIGSFAVLLRPPADAYDFQKVRDARFQFFVQRGQKKESVDTLKAVMIDGRPDDDAIWPTHRVNFGSISDVQVRLLAFSPLDRADPEKMSLPCAFYEFTVSNEGDSAATVSCALRWNVDDERPRKVKGGGLASRKWAVLADGDDPRAKVKVGSGDGFAREGYASGSLREGKNQTAVLVELAANETRTIRFVLAWYDEVDPELAHYLGRYDGAEEVARLARSNFDAMKSSAVTLVDRMRGSNLPDWLVNQTQNTLANLTVNSMYKKDGRVAFAEGQWTCFGTMDQMWHARQIVGQLIPFFAWEELHYWARTQRKDGQIHHDFNEMSAVNREERSVLVGWDDTEHDNYRRVDQWVDLNCGLIISVYETYQITGDRDRLDFFWPYVKKAAQRILDQVEAYGSHEFPFTFDDSENSYDAGGDPNPFNASMSAVAYRIMVELARERGDAKLAKTYQHAYDTVVASYRARYLEKGFDVGKHSEGYFAGQWLALHLKLGQIWTAEEVDSVLEQLDGFYHPYHWGLGNPEGTYDEWTPYILTHYAGLLLNTRRESQWRALQHDSYKRWYEDRNRVFNHPLDVLPKPDEPKWIAGDSYSGKQYISLPGIWRNYYDLVGYHRDARTGALWLTPILLDEMNHRMMDAFYVSPEGDGTISCVESGEQFQNRKILFQPDRPLAVKSLYLTDCYGDRVSVNINGQPCAVERVGEGYGKHLLVQLNGRVGSKGLRIIVEGNPGPPAPALPGKPAKDNRNAAATGGTFSAYMTIQAEAANKSAGVRMKHGAVTHCNNFDYIQFDRVDFGTTGADGFMARIKGHAQGGIEILLGGVSGELIGSCALPASSDGWAEVKTSIKKTSGVHKVVLRFYGASQENLCDLDWVKFIAE